MNFNMGERVTTPLGPGTVVYRRMAAPDYTEVWVYSVSQDSKSADPSYAGTIWPAEKVERVK